MDDYQVVEGETCPICHKKTLTLMEAERDVPYFGKCYIFSMDCDSCKYHKADIEVDESLNKGRIKQELIINSEEDLKIRVIKSSNATVKVQYVGTIEPGEVANGYVTNVEGILNRLKKQVEAIRDNSDDDKDKKKAKNILKKMTRIMWGQEPCKLTIDDPTGNSAIISDKAKKK